MNPTNRTFFNKKNVNYVNYVTQLLPKNSSVQTNLTGKNINKMKSNSMKAQKKEIGNKRLISSLVAGLGNKMKSMEQSINQEKESLNRYLHNTKYKPKLQINFQETGDIKKNRRQLSMIMAELSSNINDTQQNIHSKKRELRNLRTQLSGLDPDTNAYRNLHKKIKSMNTKMIKCQIFLN